MKGLIIKLNENLFLSYYDDDLIDGEFTTNIEKSLVFNEIDKANKVSEIFQGKVEVLKF